MDFVPFAIIVIFTFSLSLSKVNGCDLETLFNSKQVSIEDSVSSAQIIFKGFITARAPALVGYYFDDGGEGGYDDVVYTARFELINTYKGGDVFEAWKADNYRY